LHPKAALSTRCETIFDLGQPRAGFNGSFVTHLLRELLMSPNDRVTDEADMTRDDFWPLCNKHAQECMAAIGREMAKGSAGWCHGLSPQDFIRDSIANALREAGINAD
jgi:hypothetical protein